MKKSIIITLILMLVTGLVFLTGCEKETETETETEISKSFTLKNETDEFSYQATVKLSEDDVTSEIDEGKTESVRIENTKENYILDLYIDGLYESAYNEDKEWSKEIQTNFAETKFGKYDGYTYEDSDGDIAGCILLDSADQYRNIKVEFNLYLKDKNLEGSDLQAIYNSTSIQNILNNIEYKSSK